MAVSFKDAQEVARFHGNVLPDIANENHPHVVFVSQAQQCFTLTVRLQARLIADDNRSAQIKLGRTIQEKVGNGGRVLEPFRL